MNHGNSKKQLTFWSEEHHVKRSASRDSGKDWPTQEAVSHSPSSTSQITSTQSGQSGKTFPVSFPQKTMGSVAFWELLPGKMVSSNRQGKNGQTQVVCMVPKGQSLGDASTPNISVWPNDASVVSLSHVLETKEIQPRFYLSGKACAGILRRAEKRGKELPPMLRQALQLVTTQAEAPNQAK